MASSAENDKLTFEEYSSKECLEKAYETLSTQRHLVHISAAINISIRKLFPEATVHLFSFTGENTKYWICLSFFKRHWNFVNIGCEGVRDVLLFSRGFQELMKMDIMKEMEKREEFWVNADEITTREIHFLLCKVGCKEQLEQTYYIVPSPTRKLNRKELPAGYSLDRIREEDLDTIVGTWKFSTDMEKEYMRIRIFRLPSVCISDSSHTAVAWGFLEHSGYLRHMFVMPRHRRHGLQIDVTNELLEQYRTRVGGSSYCTILHTNHSFLRCMNPEDIVMKSDGTPDFLVACRFTSKAKKPHRTMAKI